MGWFSSGSAKRAAAAAAAKEAEARAALAEIRGRISPEYDPFIQAGQGALGEYERLAAGLTAPTRELETVTRSLDPIIEQIREGRYQESPGYEFRLREGQEAIERAAAARGGLFSGALGKELERYGQDFATTEYDRYINRLRNQLGDVGLQIAGRQNVLNAAYQQLNAQNPLISTGLSALGGKAAFEAGLGGREAQHTSAMGDAFAQGILGKSNQVMAQGQQVLSALGAIGGAAFGGGTGALAGAMGAQPMTTGAMTPAGYGQVGTTLPDMPWLGQGVQQQALLRTASSFA